MRCKHCQNCDLSRARPDKIGTIDSPPELVIENVIKSNCIGISYTYNEPNIWAEYVMDIAKLAQAKDIKNVMVTNGYINIKPLKEVYKYIDSANVDIKAITEKFYQSITSSHLKPVLDALVEMKSMGVWIEITNLVIPTLNDSPGEFKQLSKWVKDNLGDDVPIHFTAFHPDYKLLNLPSTSVKKLSEAKKIAQEVGMKYVYLGNVLSEEGSNTYCPSCGKLLIKRSWHSVNSYNMNKGNCSCGQIISGYFSF